jgi:NADH:ubiquinone oxidoreductase subunit F (NADH-binding)
MTQVDDGVRDDHAVPARSTAARHGGHPNLLLADVRIARTGAADPLDGDHWMLREQLADHHARLGARPNGGLWVVDALEAAGLEGRGGAFFPAARKWRAALAKPEGATVVANASESEPISAKDATLLRQRPHLVLDGLALAAETLRAARVVMWLHADALSIRLAIEDAVDERRRAGVTEPPVEFATAPHRYLAGESSAIEHALGGGPAIPVFRAFGRHSHWRSNRPPTVVHNVETLARAALLAREAAQSRPGHRAEGTAAASMRSVIVTVLTSTDRRVTEAPTSSTVEQVARAAGWAEIPGAVLLGGFGGTWASPRAVGGAAMNQHALRAVGATLGAGVVAPIPAASCGVAETAAIVAYLADSSARQCGPCLFGLESLASRLDELRLGRARRGTLRRTADDLEAVRGRGGCGHPDGATRLIASALEVFGADFAAHAQGRACDAADTWFIPVPGRI